MQVEYICAPVPGDIFFPGKGAQRYTAIAIPQAEVVPQKANNAVNRIPARSGDSLVHSSRTAQIHFSSQQDFRVLPPASGDGDPGCSGSAERKVARHAAAPPRKPIVPGPGRSPTESPTGSEASGTAQACAQGRARPRAESPASPTGPLYGPQTTRPRPGPAADTRAIAVLGWEAPTTPALERQGPVR